MSTFIAKKTFGGSFSNYVASYLFWLVQAKKMSRDASVVVSYWFAPPALLLFLVPGSCQQSGDS